MSVKKYIYSIMTDQRKGFWPEFCAGILFFLSFGYRLLVLCTHFLYEKKILPVYHAPRPVISVGNITMGGSGKTPLVVAVVHALLLRQKKVAVLTRGYMPIGSKDVSDEAQMLKELLPSVPILVGKDRIKSILEGLKHHAIDVFVCDDAFSHWPLYRDLDIIAIDARNPFGNGYVLPRGILREPLSALKRAGMFVLTKAEEDTAAKKALMGRLQLINPTASIHESLHAVAGCVDIFTHTAFDLYHFKGVSVIGFCAIGDPNSFQKTLASAGFSVVHVFVFMDHYSYSEEDMAMMRRYAEKHQVQMIVTTHKDVVKIQSFKDFWEGYKMYYLQIELEITHGKNVFVDRIVSTVAH